MSVYAVGSHNWNEIKRKMMDAAQNSLTQFFVQTEAKHPQVIDFAVWAMLKGGRNDP